MDRQKSKDAINAEIAKEKAAVKKLKERRAERVKEGRDTSDLDIRIENEQRRIQGKEIILEWVDGFARMATIDKEIAAEAALRKDGMAALERLRRQEKTARIRKQIDELARDIEQLDKVIEGKKIAKGLIV